jgi:hypothetical protein
MGLAPHPLAHERQRSSSASVLCTQDIKYRSAVDGDSGQGPRHLTATVEIAMSH